MAKKFKANSRLYGRESAKERFCALSFQLVDSMAFQHLSHAGMRVLVLLKRRFNGINNGDICLSCRDVAKACPMSRNTAGRAFQELQQKGFITQTRLGYFANGGNVASAWKLNTDKNKGENRPSNEWKKWKVGDNFLENPPQD